VFANERTRGLLQAEGLAPLALDAFLEPVLAYWRASLARAPAKRAA
jgi:hypothetical protein